MPEKRRAAFLAAMPPNFHEWDGIDQEETSIAGWRQLTADVLVVRARDTRRSVSEIFDLFHENCPRWSFAEIAEGGHMAPLSRPELIDPIIRRFLDTGRTE